jgi:hypothetical protein
LGAAVTTTPSHNEGRASLRGILRDLHTNAVRDRSGEPVHDHLVLGEPGYDLDSRAEVASELDRPIVEDARAVDDRDARSRS